MALAQENDLVLLISSDRKRFLMRLRAGADWHTHKGRIHHDDLIGQPLGRVVQTQLGHSFLILEASTTDLIQHLKRSTQIIYPKDAAHITMRLNLQAGKTVVEAGTGSGGLTLALARAVLPTGKVISYEVRADMHRLAHENLDQLGLLPYVDLVQDDVAEGFQVTETDALFYDLREPWLYLDQARAALKNGGLFGALLPTTNQVSNLLRAMEPRGFVDVEVEELLMRRYKPVPDRLRPEDRMIAHTGFLVFARKLDDVSLAQQWLAPERRRFVARQAMRANERDPG